MHTHLYLSSLPLMRRPLQCAIRPRTSSASYRTMRDCERRGRRPRPPEINMLATHLKRLTANTVSACPPQGCRLVCSGSMVKTLRVWTIREPHLSYKTGLDVAQSHPLYVAIGVLIRLLFLFDQEQAQQVLWSMAPSSCLRTRLASCVPPSQLFWSMAPSSCLGTRLASCVPPSQLLWSMAPSSCLGTRLASFMGPFWLRTMQTWLQPSAQQITSLLFYI